MGWKPFFCQIGTFVVKGIASNLRCARTGMLSGLICLLKFIYHLGMVFYLKTHIALFNSFIILQILSKSRSLNV